MSDNIIFVVASKIPICKRDYGHRYKNTDRFLHAPSIGSIVAFKCNRFAADERDMPHAQEFANILARSFKSSMT